MQNLSMLTGLEFNLNETLQLLRSPLNTYWSWGVSQLLNYKDKGLFIHVNGNHHKGWVFITLAFNDTYTVTLLNEKFKVLEINREVYFDELQAFVDVKVEYVPQYID